MELEGLGERIEREARRVAAAFEVMEWEASREVPGKASSSCVFFEGGTETEWVEWAVIVLRGTAQLLDLIFGHRTQEQEFCSFMNGGTRPCTCVPHPKYNERMVKGLYRLGMAENILAQFNHSLTTHEKLELRLSMPHEFWPKTWLDEDGEQQSR